MALSNLYDFDIIEDDCLVDIDHRSGVLPMHYYDINQRVHYIKSYSKTFMPGIRIGVVVVRLEYQKLFCDIKKCMDINTSVLHQGALYYFIKSQLFDKHLRKITKIYQDKMTCIHHNFKEDDDCMKILVPTSGLFLWIELPGDISMKTLLKTLEQKQIKVTDGQLFYRKYGKKALRLCVYNLPEEHILEGLRQIRIVLNKMKQSSH